MSQGLLPLLVRRMRRSAGVDGDASDRTLLEQFCKGDQAAFAELVRRHGAMVRGVCYRILRHAQDAEDATQAAFLVLARKAGTLAWHETVGPWLHQVAVRVARHQQAARARAHAHERAAAELPRSEGLPALAWRELCAVLDEELARLPAKYRAPLLLCYLEGRTNEEAARALGWPKGTVSGRLARGRELLRKRLGRRGLTLGTAPLAAALAAHTATAGLTPATVEALATAAQAFAAGQGVRQLPAGVRTAAEAVLPLVSGGKLKLGVLVVLLSVALGGGFTAYQLLPGDQKPAVPLSPAGLMPEGAAQPGRATGALPPGARLRLGSTRFRHGEMVLAVAVAPDGKAVASAGQDGTLRFWDRATGQETRRFADLNTVVTALAFADNGTLVGRGMSEVVVWRPGTADKLERFATPAMPIINMAPLAVSADGQRIATTGQDKVITVWDDTGRELHRLAGHAELVTGLAFTPDGRTLFSAGDNGPVREWDAVAGKEVRQLPGVGKFPTVAVALDGRVAAARGMNRFFVLWDVATGKELRRQPSELPLGAFGFTPDGKTLVTGGYDNQGGSVRYLDVATGQALRTIRCGPGGYSVAVARDGKTLATWSNESVFHLWDAEAGTELFADNGPRREIRALAFSRDGKQLATGSWQMEPLRLWDPSTGAELRTLAGTPPARGLIDRLTRGPSSPNDEGATAIAFAPNGTEVAAGMGLSAAALHVWDRQTGRERLSVNTPHAMITAVAYSPDGRVLATADYKKLVVLWDAASGQELRRFDGPFGQVKAVQFSADGATLAVAGGDFKEKEYAFGRWDVATGKELARFRKDLGPTGAVAFSPDGTALAVAGFNQTRVHVWDTATGRERQAFEHPAWVQGLMYSPDGRLLVSAGGDNEVILWEALTARERRRLPGHQGMVTALAFAPDGRTLASGSHDTSVLLWDVYGPAAAGGTVEEAWQDLAGDPARAHRAIGRLLRDSPAAVAFLKSHLRPIPTTAGQGERINRLVDDLGNDDVAVRRRASDELAALGDVAEPALRRKLAARPPLEVRQRIEPLLARLEPATSPELLRTLRALEVLEHTATPEARALLQSLAAGDPTARLTREAAAALGRSGPRR